MNFESEPFTRQDDGILVPLEPVEHCEDEYDSAGFDALVRMQACHFWYQGRHRFLLHALRSVAAKTPADHAAPAMIDLGGGCGGWVKYLTSHAKGMFSEIALGDSSLYALRLAARILPPGVQRYQVDLLRLPWQNRWDVIFLLDVLEHLPADANAMQQVGKALRPGGHLLVTMPAIQKFWTYNDDLARHQRRYTRGDLARLAEQSGLRLCWSRYFMFFLSPLLLLTRARAPNWRSMTHDEIVAHQMHTHRVPPSALNFILKSIFALETPLGKWLPFPWGTSVLGVFQKPL